MKIIFIRNLFLLTCILMAACKTSQNQIAIEKENEILLVTNDTVITEENKKENIFEVDIYKGEKTRYFKLLHTRLEVSFDWEKQHMFGKATLIVEPFFFNQSNIILDAKGFEIHEVLQLTGDESIELNYKYDGDKLNIDLQKDYQRGQKIILDISYTSKPNEGEYSYDIVNDKKGLYFINPQGLEKDKPMQIWTHGETESNSRWFPTLDAPNQKSTQEIYITVDSRFKTLSNGILVYSKSNLDSTRTDYWKMDKPHAPYLFMMAVGNFYVAEDNWNDMKVDYYMESKYVKYAKDIFGNTPEMITFFSEVLNYPYPWDKYSQVVVRDFVSGAMENTSASVFMEDLNVNSRELLDYNWDDIIAHELFHQWFGNLVTCESWANISLNESFATYGEYLWKDHKYGQNESAFLLYEELENYLTEAETEKKNLIRFQYDKDDEMFDNHSYAKGGLILHLLRSYLGDDAFFQSLEFYLKSYEFGKAEIHELRLVFEHISGEDLNWFFNQWFLSAGHPILRVEEYYNEVQKELTLKVWQDQNIEKYPVYKLPLKIDIWENGINKNYTIEINEPYQELKFGDIKNPELILFDSDFVLVGEITHKKNSKQYKFQFDNYNNNVRARIIALEYFIEQSEDSISRVAISQALIDPFWVIREKALVAYELDSSGLFSDAEVQIVNLAMKDPNPFVKSAAISVLGEKENLKYIDVYRTNLTDSSYSVSGISLYEFLQTGSNEIDSVIEYFRGESNFNISSSLADYFIMQQKADEYKWFVEKLHIYKGGELWYFIKFFGMYLFNAPNEQIAKGIIELEKIAKHSYHLNNRISAYQSLELLSDHQGVQKILDGINLEEKDK